MHTFFEVPQRVNDVEERPERIWNRIWMLWRTQCTDGRINVDGVNLVGQKKKELTLIRKVECLYYIDSVPSLRSTCHWVHFFFLPQFHKQYQLSRERDDLAADVSNQNLKFESWKAPETSSCLLTLAKKYAGFDFFF